MKPILFNTEMVRAILDGRKTVTRRVVKPQPPATSHVAKIRYSWSWSWWEDSDSHKMKPPYRIGDILYVRETFFEHNGHFYYKADGKHEALAQLGITFKWRPSIHMPREAARIFLRVTDVRVERLQDITPEQIDAEGCKEFGYSVETGELMPSSPCYFSIVWNNTVKKADRALYGWDANPWVFVISFERISKDEALQ